MNDCPMRMRTVLVIFIFLFIISLPLLSQTIRPSHWLSNYLFFEQMRGYLWSLSPLCLPYDSEEILLQIDRELAGSGDATRVAYERSLYIINRLRKNPARNGDMTIGIETNHYYEDWHSRKYYHTTNRLNASIRIKSWLEVVTAVLQDNRLDENPRYMGIKQNGQSAYTEQAYVRLRYAGFAATWGRDYIRLGPGLDATLLISDQSRPLDHLSLSYGSRWWRYTFIAAELDPFFEAINGETVQQNRYFSLHHLEIRPWRYFYFGIGEAILYGGPEANMSMTYLNPVLFFHGEQMNGPIGGNTLGSLYFCFMPTAGLLFYGDLLIDDVQIEKKDVADQEPNEYGTIAGFRLADPFRLRGLDIYAEITRITNRTYNGQGGSWEKWLHRNQPVGHFLGNDFDRIVTGFSYWPVSRYSFRCQFERRRRGEGRIEKPFDTPWLDWQGRGRYSEPFPTGIVEKSDRLQFSFTWQPLWWCRVFTSLEYISVKNEENQLGDDTTFWQGYTGISIEGLTKIRLE